MNFIWKWLTVPKPGEITQIRAIELWEVRWYSRHGEYSHSTSPQVEMFTSKEDADNFATALRNAFILVKNTSENNVVVKKAS